LSRGTGETQEIGMFRRNKSKRSRLIWMVKEDR
jgi:hypothetical protein